MKIAKLLVICSLVLAFAFGTAGVGSVSAQAGISNLTSGMQVYNQGTGTATITITIYAGDGSVLGTISDTINASSSKTYFPITGGGLPATFTGSAVISSDQPVAAINNTITADLQYGASTDSFAGGSSPFYIPLVMCGNGGFNTFFSVQNAGTAAANITINYNAVAGTSGSETAVIAVGASKTFDQTLGSATKNCSTLGTGSPQKFVGSATITSDQPVVASVMQTNTSTFKVLMGYNGFTGGSTSASLPLVMSANGGLYTGIQVQNVGTASTVATITYSANNAGGATPALDTCTLAVGQSCTLLQQVTANAKWGAKYVGSAVVTASQPVVAIVNQVLPGTASLGPWGSAYEGFDTAAATTNVTAPLLMANNGGMYTGIQIQNVGTGTCSVTLTYGPNTGGSFAPALETFSLNSGLSKTILQNADPASGNGSVNTWTGKKYVGAGEVTATGTGCKVVSIVNEVLVGKGDFFFTYDAFSH